MSDYFTFGSEFRDFLRGLLGTTDLRQAWGPRVNMTGLYDIYAPNDVEQYTVPAGGLDNLALHSTDIFSIPGRGEFTVDFQGYFRVARGHPTTFDWTTFEIFVNIVDLRLFGHHEEIGDIAVSLNRDVTSTGQIFPAATGDGPAKCRIATAAIFDLPELGVTVFNKEPILLMNEHVVSIPPVDDPSGHALLFMLPLYDRNDPEGKPLGHLTSLRYGADNYITESEAREFRRRPHRKAM